MTFLYVKAVHIIFVVTWFSGMFYLVRLFVYNREAQDKPEPAKSVLQEQFQLMISRLLFGITWPSAVITLGMGIWLLLLYPNMPLWLHLKLGLVLLLFAYHYSLHLLYQQQKRGDFRFSSQQLRLWNEVPTLFLVAIVMLVVVKQQISLVYGLLGLVTLVIVLMSAIRVYKQLRLAREKT
ncbi:MAG: CopD family protein [Phaeodactylibacter sp.]|nr:CopD family protein [Phaeodactylibacter sp.]